MTISSEIYYQNLNENDLLQKLKTTYEGISEEEAKKRLEIYGPNELSVKKKRTRLQLLLSQFTNGITYILVAAAIISLIVGKIVNVAVIVAVILLNGLIGFVQEAKAESALNSLKKMASPEADVIRNCKPQSQCIEFRIKSRELVPGDLILLEAGDKIPADARLIEIANFEVDESMLTGESLPVRKELSIFPINAPLADRKNLVYSGTLVTAGRARAFVFSTGMKTEMGKITTLIDETEEIKSPLQKRIDDLTKKLGILAVGISLLTFIIGVLRGFDIVEMLLFGIATLVSSIPAGLPAAITITLAVGVQKMARRHAIIRKLSAIDSLGAVTTITTDKTGTLTTNQMTVRKIYVNSKIYEISGIGYEPIGKFTDTESNKIVEGFNEDDPESQLLKTAVLCNEAHLVDHKISEDKFQWKIKGDPTEGALLVAAAKLNIQKENFRLKFPRIDEIPFDSKYRFMVTFNENSQENSPNRIEMHIKGAPRSILNLSSNIMEGKNKKSITPDIQNKILEISNSFAAQGLRVLGFASMYTEQKAIDNVKKQLTKEEKDKNTDSKSRFKNLNFIGLIAMIDPPREEVKDAIKLTKSAGIKTIMATGDHKLTAKAIGEEIGIIKENSEIIEGFELEEMTDEELDQRIFNVAAFVRVSPTHKFRVVNSLQRKNNIVAMTGDGANDAPALKSADIGIAMGITGTDISKETAKMVLTDDNFTSIVNAIEEGRVVGDNIRKGLKFLLTTNIGEILTILLSIIILTDNAPLFTALAILWVNLVTDGSLTVAIAREPKESDVMKKKPKPVEQKVLDKDMLLGILFTAVIMASGVLIISQLHGATASITEKQTLAFNALAFYQIVNAINCRSKTQSIFQLGFWSNRSISIGLLVSLSLQILAVQAPFMNIILGTIPLGILDWIIIISGSLSLLLAEELRKLIIRKRQSIKS